MWPGADQLSYIYAHVLDIDFGSLISLYISAPYVHSLGLELAGLPSAVQHIDIPNDISLITGSPHTLRWVKETGDECGNEESGRLLSIAV